MALNLCSIFFGYTDSGFLLQNNPKFRGVEVVKFFFILVQGSENDPYELVQMKFYLSQRTDNVHKISLALTPSWRIEGKR